MTEPRQQSPEPRQAPMPPHVPRGAALNRVLSRLTHVRRTRSGYTARCPAHEDDSNDSMSIDTGHDGRVLLKCFAGCAPEAIVGKLGLKMRDLFENGRRPRVPAVVRAKGGGGSIAPISTATLQPPPSAEGLTLARYAEAKRLPVDFLKGLGLTDFKLNGMPTVRIPYLDAEGSEVAVRFRLALSGENRFRWKNKAKPLPYGLQRLAEARAAGYVVIDEGESDTQTFWLHGIPAIGLPGAASWREAWADHLDGIPTIYVPIEADAGGQQVLKWLASSSIRERVRLIRLRDAKDPSELYLSDPDRFRERWQLAVQESIPWAEEEQRQAQERMRATWEKCESLARQPRILDRFAAELAACGVAGEARVVKLIYLAVTSRLLPKLVSIAIKGPSSGGKSYLVQRVAEFMPPSAYYALTGMSEKALAYSEEPLEHRFLILYEATGVDSKFANYLMRSLLSEGQLRYVTVEKTNSGLRPRLIEREGPTGLVTTTTVVRLHRENETRLISVTISDTQDQTRDVMLAQAEEDPKPPDHQVWHALQEWLEGTDNRVTIPFSRELAKLIPPVAVRLRRDFPAILSLIRAHALLHKASRERDERGRIVVSLDDYAVVRELVFDLVAEGVDATVSTTMRETVAAVNELAAENENGATVAALARRLRLDKGSASRRASAAIDRGYLKNLETRKGQPAQLVPDEPLPQDVEVLPSVERLGGCTVAVETAGISTPPPVPHVLADWPEEWREAYEERLAIMTVEGCLPLSEAMKKAVECVRREFAA